MKKRRTSYTGVLQTMALFGQLGLTMAIPILIGVFAGAWIDNKLNSQPIVLIIMILMGLAAGILGAYHQIAVILPRQKGKHAGKTNSDQNERDADRF